ncbi:Atp-binding protein, partial [Globisporangium splendens]
MEPIVYQSSTPTAFGVSYTNPPIQPNDTTGYCLRFGELAFERGYGRDPASSRTQTPMVGQYGGFVLHGSEATQALGYNIMANSTSTHSAPTYEAMMDESIHRFLLSKKSPNSTTHVTVRVSTHPFPLSFKTKSIFNSYLSLPAVVFIVIAFTFVPASMMPFLVKEKQSEQNAKHQQLLSGVSFAAYWIANFVFDTLLYLVPMAAAIILLRSYGIVSSLNSHGNESKSCRSCIHDVPAAVLSLFFLFGGAIAPWTYLISQIMRDPGACLLYTVMLNFFLGLLLIIMSYSFDTLESTRTANEALIFLWRCSPLFSLGNGLLRVIIADIKALYGLSGAATSAFSPEVAGNEIACLAIECPLFFLLALGADWIKTGEFSGFGSRPSSSSSRWRQFIQSCRSSSAKLHAQDTISAFTEDADVAEEAALQKARGGCKSTDFVAEYAYNRQVPLSVRRATQQNGNLNQRSDITSKFVRSL